MQFSIDDAGREIRSSDIVRSPCEVFSQTNLPENYQPEKAKQSYRAGVRVVVTMKELIKRETFGSSRQCKTAPTYICRWPAMTLVKARSLPGTVHEGRS